MSPKTKLKGNIIRRKKHQQKTKSSLLPVMDYLPNQPMSMGLLLQVKNTRCQQIMHQVKAEKLEALLMQWQKQQKQTVLS